MLVFSLVLALTPWLLGAQLMYGVLATTNLPRPVRFLLAIGSGSYIGYVLISAQIYLLFALEIQITRALVFTGILAQIAALFMLQNKHHFARAYLPIKSQVTQNFIRKKIEWFQSIKSPWVTLALLSWLISNLYFVAHEIWLRPAVAWDTVWYWTRYSSQLLDSYINPSAALGQTLSGRHPPFGQLLSIYSSISADQRTQQFLYLPWFSLYVGLAITLAGLSLHLHNHILFGLLGAILITSSPVAEAHVSLGGYMDFWLAAGVFYAVLILYLAQLTQYHKTFIILFIVVLASITLTKTAGLSYSIPLLLAGVLLAIYSRPLSGTKRGIPVLIIPLILLLSQFEFSIRLFGYQIAFEPDTKTLRLAHYTGHLDFSPSLETLSNFNHALFTSGAYGMSLVLIVTLIIAIIASKEKFSNKVTPFFFIALICTLTHLVVAHEISEQVAYTATPYRNTGLSRFLLTPFMFAVATLVVNVRSTYYETPLTKIRSSKT